MVFATTLAASSATQFPQWVTFVGSVVGVALVAVALVSAFLIFRALLGRMGIGNGAGSVDLSAFVKPVVGAMLIGSASGAVLWSSTLTSVAEVAEPATVKPAYENVKENAVTKPVSGKKAEDVELVKKVLGSHYEEANKLAHFDSSGNLASEKAYLLYKPAAGNEEAADSCYEIKVVYFTSNDEKTGLANAPGMGKKVKTYSPNGFSADECGSSEVKKLSE